jgi:HEPN domain-containing protein
MITGEDIDRCIIDQYASEFKDMTVDEAKDALEFAERDLEEVAGWVDALNAFLRVEGAQV